MAADGCRSQLKNLQKNTTNLDIRSGFFDFTQERNLKHNFYLRHKVNDLGQNSSRVLFNLQYA